MRTGIMFGTFDGLHPGHLFMLNEASSLVDRLTVVLPSDNSVASMKGKSPTHSWETRATSLRETGLVYEVLLGDNVPGTYSALLSCQPRVVFLGYDQNELAEDVARFIAEHELPITLHVLHAHHPELFKSSKLKNV